MVRDFLQDVFGDKLFNSVLVWFNEVVRDTSRFLGDWYGVFFHRQMNLYLLTISCCLANSVKTDLGFSLAQDSHFRFSSPLCWALLICQFHQSLACQVSLSVVLSVLF